MTVAELDHTTRPLAPFSAGVDAEGAATVVTLRGEADTFTLPAVVAELARAISEHDGPVVVDLAETTFIDVATLRALGRAAQFLALRDRTLTVRGPSRMAVRLLAFLGLTDLVRIGPPQQDVRPFAPTQQ